MKGRYFALIIALLFILAVSPAAADSTSVPLLPLQLYGDVTAGGTPAPDGTVITAKVGDQSFTITTKDGKYGGSGTFDQKLLVSSSTAGDTISFYAGSEKSDVTTTYQVGKVQKLDLTFATFPADSQEGNSGSNGGNTGTTPGTQQPTTNTQVPLPNDGISYQRVNPGTGTFSYTTTDGGVFTVNKMTVFGALYASTHTIGDTVDVGSIAINTIDGKSGKSPNGWMYSLNGEDPGAYSNTVSVKHGDIIRWWYSESAYSTPQNSAVKFGIVVDTSSGSTSSVMQQAPQPTQTETPENTLYPTSTITETKSIVSADGYVSLGQTQIIKAVDVSDDILIKYPGASVKVIEGNTQILQLPTGVTSDKVSLVFDVSVVGIDGQELIITTPGKIIFSLNVPAGKQLLVGHKNAIGIWENCPVQKRADGLWEATYPSLSPFIIVLIDEGVKNPFVMVEIPTDTVPTTTETATPTPTKTQPTKSPLSFVSLVGILAGAGILGLERRNRH